MVVDAKNIEEIDDLITESGYSQRKQIAFNLYNFITTEIEKGRIITSAWKTPVLGYYELKNYYVTTWEFSKGVKLELRVYSHEYISIYFTELDEGIYHSTTFKAVYANETNAKNCLKNILLTEDIETANLIPKKMSESEKEETPTIDYSSKPLGQLRKLCQDRGIVAWDSDRAAVIGLLQDYDKNGGTLPDKIKEVPVTIENGKFASEIAASLKPHLQAELVSEETIKGLIEVAVKKEMATVVKEIAIKKPDLPNINLGMQHYMFPLIHLVASCHVPIFLVGPAGSGKTTIASNVSRALFDDDASRFSANAFCNQSSKHDLIGYTDANGNFVETEFYKRFTTGGVWLGDEFDNGNANVSNVINTALANNYMAFPNGMKSMHEDFYCIVSGNTYGQGADRVYIGRNQLDAANLDRFAFILMDYDEGLEASLVGAKAPVKEINIEEGGVLTNPQEWVEYIHKIRKAVDSTKKRMVISPRATSYACKLSSVGIGRKWVEDFVIWKGVDTLTRDQIRASAGFKK